MMKLFTKIISAIVMFIVTGITLSATTTSAANILKQSADNLRQSPSVTIKFTLSQGAHAIPGEITLATEKFIATLNGGGTTWYDGTTQWVYNPDIDEMNISTPTLEELSAINPFVVVTYLQSTYKVRQLEAPSGFYAIEFTPVSPDGYVKKMVLTLDRNNKCSPTKIVLTMPNGQVATITVNSITPGKRLEIKDFQPDKSKFPNAEWIDLR